MERRSREIKSRSTSPPKKKDLRKVCKVLKILDFFEMGKNRLTDFFEKMVEKMRKYDMMNKESVENTVVEKARYREQ